MSYIKIFNSFYYYTDRLSIWLSVDPQADKYYSISSYAWCGDNSVAYYRYDDSGKRELKLLGRRSDVYNMGNQYKFVNFDDVVLYAGDLATFDRQGFKKHYFVEGRRFLTNVGSVGMPIMDEEHLQELAHSEDIERSSMMFEENLIDYLTTRRNACSYVAASIDIGWLEWMAEWCREILTKEEKNLPYYLHTDRLGSGTVVTNEKGDAVHILTYMPYGETLLDLSQDFETPYQFTGYEKDPESGLYYAGARYQVPRLGSFNSTDPLWWKSPDKTSYHYCSNNPIMRVDPDGRLDDEWDINSKGEVVNRIKTDKHDAFYIVDDNGRRIDGKSISFEYGTIKSQITEFTPFYNKTRGELITHSDTYNFKDNNSGYRAYLFLFQNTDVEWSHTQW